MSQARLQARPNLPYALAAAGGLVWIVTASTSGAILAAFGFTAAVTLLYCATCRACGR